MSATLVIITTAITQQHAPTLSVDTTAPATLDTKEMEFTAQVNNCVASEIMSYFIVSDMFVLLVYEADISVGLLIIVLYCWSLHIFWIVYTFYMSLLQLKTYVLASSQSASMVVIVFQPLVRMIAAVLVDGLVSIVNLVNIKIVTIIHIYSLLTLSQEGKTKPPIISPTLLYRYSSSSINCV